MLVTGPITKRSTVFLGMSPENNVEATMQGSKLGKQIWSHFLFGIMFDTSLVTIILRLPQTFWSQELPCSSLRRITFSQFRTLYELKES